jgi:hypothetical protein
VLISLAALVFARFARRPDAVTAITAPGLTALWAGGAGGAAIDITRHQPNGLKPAEVNRRVPLLHLQISALSLPLFGTTS